MDIEFELKYKSDIKLNFAHLDLRQRLQFMNKSNGMKSLGLVFSFLWIKISFP